MQLHIKLVWRNNHQDRGNHGGIAPTKRAYSEQNTIDRTFLNKEISSFEKVVPTAENIAVRIGQLWRSPVRELRAELHKIKDRELNNLQF